MTRTCATAYMNLSGKLKQWQRFVMDGAWCFSSVLLLKIVSNVFCHETITLQRNGKLGEIGEM